MMANEIGIELVKQPINHKKTNCYDYYMQEGCCLITKVAA